MVQIIVLALAREVNKFYEYLNDNMKAIKDNNYIFVWKIISCNDFPK